MLFFLGCIALISMFGGILGANLESEYNLVMNFVEDREMSLMNLKYKDINESISECSERYRIDMMVKCMHEDIENIYTYKVRNDSEKISISTLYQEGGDCGNWADFWVNIGKEFGYDTKKIRIGVNESVNHVFTVISGEEGYCWIDQTNYDCFIYGN